MVTDKPSTPRSADDRYKRRRFAEMDAAYSRQLKRLRRVVRNTRSQLSKGRNDPPEQP
jgi:hypothetical protein